MEQELLYKYFKGTTSEEEERLILDWVDASPENRKAFQKERMLYDIALFTDEKQMNRKDRKARIIPCLLYTSTRYAYFSALRVSILTVSLECYEKEKE